MEDKFYNFMINSGLSKNTSASYVCDIKKYKEYYYASYGEDLKELIHADIITYRTYLEKHNISYTSINRKLSALKQYNLFLISENVQLNIAVLKKDYYKIQPSIIAKKIPSPQEINKLKHFAIKDEKRPKRDYCMLTILIYGGLRESELVTLRLIDISLENRTINIVGKGNKFRQIVINSVMYDAISEYLEERNSLVTNNPYLFVGQKNINTTKPFNRNMCNRLLSKYNALCNITNLHPHALRSYFCTNALHNAGYTIDQVANQAGHCSLNTTKAYLINTTDSLLDLANKL